MRSVWSARLFQGDGRNFCFLYRSCRVFTSWRKAHARRDMEVATNRPTKLRFPQGSEVLTGGCPKFGAAATSGLTNPEARTEVIRPELRRWRAASASPRSWSRALLQGR